MNEDDIVMIARALSSPKKVMVWRSIKEGKGKSLMYLAKVCGIDPSYLRRILDDLIMADLIYRDGNSYYARKESVILR